MILPALAPQPGHSASSVAPSSRLALVHHESEWLAKYPEIERLYVTERRKLRYVIRYMESEHGFKATEQMYKKRFAKWGFQKSSKSSASAVQTWKRTAQCRKLRLPERRGSISLPASRLFGPYDRLKLTFLTSVQTWGISFFESARSVNGFLASSKDRQHPLNQPHVSLIFRLALDRLNRGHGKLAGRLARKAFRLLEDLLLLGAPAFIWNLLEMMHFMVAQGHVHLFQMLLAHLAALADGKIPGVHPLSTMLRSLRGFVAMQSSVASDPSGPSSSASSSSPSSFVASNEVTNTFDPCLLIHTLPSLLEEAWNLNAKILFDHFDPELIELYCQMFCDSCSINLQGSVADAAVHLLTQVEMQQRPSIAAEACLADGYPINDTYEGPNMLQRILAPRKDVSPPQDYEMLHASSLAALCKYRDSMLSNEAGQNDGANIGILAATIMADILEGQPAAIETSNRAKRDMAKVPRIFAGNVAGAIKSLMGSQVQTDSRELGAFSDNVDRIRTLVALREYALGEADPLVVQEMWLLEDELVAAGECVEAQAVGLEASRRLEMYLEEIPVDSA